LELHRRREQLVERTRREAQLAALQYEEEKIRTKQMQRDAVLDFVKGENKDQADAERCCPGLCQAQSVTKSTKTTTPLR